MSEIECEKIELFKQACKKIDIIYRGAVLSDENIIRQYIDFLANNMFDEKHNVVLTLHNGSIIYDVINVACYVLAIISMNDLDVDAIADSLIEGQKYIYGNNQTRIEYAGKDEDSDYYVFKSKKWGIRKIPKENLAALIPYYGNAKTLGTIGAGEQHTSLAFQKQVLGIDNDKATSYVNASVIIVAEHNYFTDLLNNTVIRCNNDEYKITDIIAVSFFTDENESPYAGNSNRIEANLKVTNNMSTARELIFHKEENEIIGFSALGLKGVKNTIGELEDALKRKKLSFSAVSYDIGDDVDGLYGLLGNESLPVPKVYACTKDFLLSNYLGVKSKQELFQTYNEKCDRIIEKNFEYKVIDGWISWRELINIYNTLHELRRIMAGDELTEKFVIESYGMLRLMISSIVPLKEFEDKRDIDVDYVTPSEKLVQIKNYEPVSNNISMYVDKIKKYIDKLYSMLYFDNPKAVYLSKAVDRRVRTVIVVDKKYYKPIIQRYFSKRGLANAFSIYTERRAKEEQYDDMFIVGKLDNSNIMNWNKALNQKYVLYEAEYKLFAWNLKKYQDKTSLLNQLSYYTVYEEELFVDEINAADEEVKEVVSEIKEIDSIEQNFMIQNAILHSNSFTTEANSVPAEITRVAVCETGESIYFTKYYKAFVLDIDRKIVKEIEVKDIKNGDSLIFTVNNGKTKDIAELVLARFAQNSKNSNLADAIDAVKKWKDSLIQIKEDYDFTYTDLSRLFKLQGYNATAQTIRAWIDQDCHVVGPINEEAYSAMAAIFSKYNICNEFVINTKQFIAATQLVRNQRTAILGIIANVIVAKYTKNVVNLDKSFDGVITEDIVNLSVLMRIDQIRDVEKFTVPNSKANKPILV